jgi:hypothetical protein
MEIRMKWTKAQSAIRQRFLQRPWWLKWVIEAPMPVQLADERMRSSFFFRQIPLCLLLLVLFKLRQWVGVFPHPLWGMWILAFAGIAFVWPVPLVRLGLVACDNARSTQGKMQRRLQILCMVNLLASGLAFLLVVALIAGMGWLTVVCDRPVS